MTLTKSNFREKRRTLSYTAILQAISKGTQGRKSRQAPENRPALLFTPRQVCRAGVWSRFVGVHANLHMETRGQPWSLSCSVHLFFLLRQVSQWPGTYNAGWPQAPEIRLPLPTTEIRSTHHHTWLSVSAGGRTLVLVIVH